MGRKAYLARYFSVKIWLCLLYNLECCRSKDACGIPLCCKCNWLRKGCYYIPILGRDLKQKKSQSSEHQRKKSRTQVGRVIIPTVTYNLYPRPEPDHSPSDNPRLPPLYLTTIAISPPPNFIPSIKIRNTKLGPRVSDLQSNLPNLPETAPILCKYPANNTEHHNYYPAQPHMSNYDTSLLEYNDGITPIPMRRIKGTFFTRAHFQN